MPEQPQEARSAAGSHYEPLPAEDFEYDDRDEYDCTWCGGEGEFFGNELPGYDPGWHLPDELYPCPACRGTGDRKDQVLF